MPGEIDLPFPDAGSLKRGRFTYFPVVPGRVEFAIEVRQAILRDRPQIVALELPASLQAVWMRAVARLPNMSLIFYPDEASGDDQAIYVPVEPADPFTEAIRTGLEVGAEIVFTDPKPPTALISKTPTPTLTPSATSVWRAMSTPIASIRRRAPKRLRATPPESPGSSRGPIPR